MKTMPEGERFETTMNKSFTGVLLMKGNARLIS
jgi:hypothetical protein